MKIKKRLKNKNWRTIYISPQEDIAERVKLERQETWKQLKILTLNKVLTRLSMLSVQINARNNSYKLKNEIKQMSNLLYQHKKVTETPYNSGSDC